MNKHYHFIIFLLTSNMLNDANEMLCKNISKLNQIPGILILNDEYSIQLRGYRFKRESLIESKSNSRITYRAQGMTTVPVVCKVTMLDCLNPRLKENLLKNSSRIMRFIGGNGSEPPHETFVRMYELFQVDLKIYQFMDEIKPISILMMIKQHYRISEFETREWVHSICHAIRYIQQYGIAHRNIKIDHIHFDLNRKVKLTGWNRSVLFWDPTNEQIVEQYKEIRSESNCHMPPEAFSNYYDPSRADIWSLGVLLSTIHTRRNIFKVKSKVSFAMQWVAFASKHRFNEHVYSLLQYIFVFSPQERPSIDQILNHSYWNAPPNEIERIVSIGNINKQQPIDVISRWNSGGPKVIKGIMSIFSKESSINNNISMYQVKSNEKDDSI